jgi:hypothetical protein
MNEKKGIRILPFAYVVTTLEVLHQNPRFPRSWVPSIVLIAFG